MFPLPVYIKALVSAHPSQEILPVRGVLQFATHNLPHTCANRGDRKEVEFLCMEDGGWRRGWRGEGSGNTSKVRMVRAAWRACRRATFRCSLYSRTLSLSASMCLEPLPLAACARADQGTHLQQSILLHISLIWSEALKFRISPICLHPLPQQGQHERVQSTRIPTCLRGMLMAVQAEACDRDK